MLHSPTRRLIFVHIPKTGGNSIKALLRAHLTDVEKIGKQHDLAAWHCRELPDWEGCFKFAVVRNPWDRLLSWHSYMVVRGRPPPWHRRLRGRDRRSRIARYTWRQGRSFEDFVLRCTDVIDDAKAGRRCYAWDQVAYLTDADGRWLVDFVGRFERFAADVQGAFARVGLHDVVVPHTNTSAHRHYSHYYTDRLRDVVAQRFARDIAAFGYQFEAAAPGGDAGGAPC